MSHPDIRGSVEELPCQSDDLFSFSCERYRQCTSMNQPVAESLLQSADLLWNHTNEPGLATQKRLQASRDIHKHVDILEEHPVEFYGLPTSLGPVQSKYRRAYTNLKPFYHGI